LVFVQIHALALFRLAWGGAAAAGRESRAVFWRKDRRDAK